MSDDKKIEKKRCDTCGRFFTPINEDETTCPKCEDSYEDSPDLIDIDLRDEF